MGELLGSKVGRMCLCVGVEGGGGDGKKSLLGLGD